LRSFIFGRAPVLFFFVLSGFVLTRSLLRHGSPGLLTFALQRSIRLGLPAAAAVVLSALLYGLTFDPEAHAALGLMWDERPTLPAILRQACLIGADQQFPLDGVLWSLVHEWRLTLFLPLILAFRRHPTWLLVLALIVTGLGLAGGANENTVMLGTHLHGTVPATLYFSLASGAALAMANPPLLAPAQRIPAGIAAAVLLSMQSDMAVYAAAVLLILLARGPGRFPALLRSSPLIWAGRLSFSLYLVHMPVFAASFHVLFGYAPRWAAPLVAALLSWPVAALFYRAVERPARQWARRVEAAHRTRFAPG
jgi:peptidoglycan/LPS O-acetylase OafA/YrhL